MCRFGDVGLVRPSPQWPPELLPGDDVKSATMADG